MSEPGTSASPTRFVVIFASLVIVVAGVKAASSIIVPLLSAAFLAVLSLPLMHSLEKRGVPRSLRLACVLFGLVVLTLLVLFVLGSSLSEFQGELDGYKDGLGQRVAGLKVWLKEHGVEMGDALSGAIDPGFILGFLGQAITELGGLMSSTFVILLWLAFMLVEAYSFQAKLAALSNDPERMIGRINQILDSVTGYFSIKFCMSLGTGLGAGLRTWFVGVDSPVLWGFVAFLLNFVPNIGSFIAAVPPVLLALIQPELGWGSVVALVVGYALLNVLLGSVIEPRLLGRGLDLSTMVVFASLVFWGWVLGPVGMLLSVPLTITVKIGLEAFEETRGIALMLGCGVAEPERPA